MEIWEIFEQNCLRHLKTQYENGVIKFEAKGGSDSTIPDIEAFTTQGESFFIEVKMPNAQSGQFVLLKEGNQFIYSPKNKSPQTYETRTIQTHINSNFSTFENVGTTAINITLPSSSFSSWIINYYKSKGVKFVVSQFNGDFVILPIERFADYFNIEANFRIKKSGSGELPKKYITEVAEFFSSGTVSQEGKKVYLYSTMQSNKQQFSIGDIDIQLSLKAPNKYEIRKLSNTKNANVIFSIKCVKTQEAKDLDIFESTL